MFHAHILLRAKAWDMLLTKLRCFIFNNQMTRHGNRRKNTLLGLAIIANMMLLLFLLQADFGNSADHMENWCFSITARACIKEIQHMAGE